MPENGAEKEERTGQYKPTKLESMVGQAVAGRRGEVDPFELLYVIENYNENEHLDALYAQAAQLFAKLYDRAIMGPAKHSFMQQFSEVLSPERPAPTGDAAQSKEAELYQRMMEYCMSKSSYFSQKQPEKFQ